MENPTPYCGTAPLPAEFWTRWNWDPLLLLAIAAALFLSLRLPPPSRKPAIAFTGIWAILYISPFCAIGSALFSARSVHHLVLILIAAPLLARAAAMLPKRGSLASWTVLQALVLWFWHAPPAYDLALSNSAAFWLMQLSILLTATGFWHALARSELPGRIIALFATMMQMSLLGALLAFARSALYRPHWLTTQPWGLSPLDDQQLAGILMWIPGGTLYLAAALFYAWHMLAEQQDDGPAYVSLGERV
ncbi:cytochrome c oxidase assembly protein [Sphingobium agri]|uniref:Cytochrome c oxidase assembly protein n=1 Tax=Sphingobium agri TaxID=2933566 RepID=A0ABT0E0N5_9SPHN|nr:cytochrome c oxidase assembly protein [Sphingobium agri]MCK0532895.1 cytochrome c oxidase assembly protein [Sphingobium agri]